MLHHVKALSRPLFAGGIVLLSANLYSGECTAQCVQTESHKITRADGEEHDQFGNDVDVSNGTIIVGTWLEEGGSAYGYQFDGDSVTEIQKLTASDGSFRFGTRVVLDSTATVAVVGAPDAEDDMGAVYVYP